MVLEILYAIIAGLADVFGGWLGSKTRFSRVMPRYIIGFAAGILITLTFLNVLPEIDLSANAWIVGVGFFTFYIIEKLVSLHACGEAECETHKLGGLTVFGMALDNIIDGIGIAVGYLMSPALGAIITIGVVIHEIPQGMVSAVIMKNAGYARKRMYTVLGIAGILYPIGAFVSRFVPPGFNELVLAFIAGDFLYIGASDMLPEAHKKYNWMVMLSVIIGIAFVVVLSAIFGPI